MHSPKGLARARESSIVDVNKYPDWTNAGRAGPLVSGLGTRSTIERKGSGSNPVRCFFFFFFSRATDQQYGIRTFEDNSKLHGHTNEHVQLIRRGTSRD